MSAQSNNQTPTPNNSGSSDHGYSEAEIKALEEKVRTEEATNWWANKTTLVLLAVYGLLSLAIAFTTVWINRSGDRLRSVDSLLAGLRMAKIKTEGETEARRIESEARERLEKTKQESDEKIAGLTAEAERAKAERAEANKQIANAEVRAQEAQTRAVEATAEVSRFRVTIANAETKRLEAERRLLEIQKTIPRRLTPEQYLALVEALKPFAGHQVMVSPIRATPRMTYPEIEGIAEQIMDALRDAGWKYSSGMWSADSLSDKGIHNLSPGITPLFFRSEASSEPFQILVRELRKAGLYVLNIARGPLEGDRHFEDGFSEVLIIGEKP